MKMYKLNGEQADSVLFRLQCVHAALLTVHAQSLSKSLYCVIDELMHVADELSDFMAEGEIDE